MLKKLFNLIFSWRSDVEKQIAGMSEEINQIHKMVAQHADAGNNNALLLQELSGKQAEAMVGAIWVMDYAREKDLLWGPVTIPSKLSTKIRHKYYRVVEEG